MGDLIDKAFEALRTLPVADRDRIAWEILERVEDKTEWDRIVASPTAQAWLGKEAETALAEYARIMKTLSHTFISISQDNLLREDPYWQHFDDLPPDIKKLAEANYRLFKDNPKDPALRFRGIHDSPPICSFRVGMRHRTIGVETDDGKVVWFWVGSVEDFRKTIAEN